MPVPGYMVRFPRKGAGTGQVRQVAMRDKEWKVFDQEILALSKARLEATMKAYCASGPIGLPGSLFKFLEHYETQGLKVRLEEFKAKGVRLFGFCALAGKVPTFFITGSDTDKKRRKANQTLVDLAGKEAVRLLKILSPVGKRGKAR